MVVHTRAVMLGAVWLALIPLVCGGADAVLCEIGEALKDASNPAALDRGCGFGCPANYYCVRSPVLPSGSVCCPAKTYVCSLPAVAGAACGRLALRCQKWRFDRTTGQCQQFWYNGCFGNNNNFATRQECEYLCRGQYGQAVLATGSLCPIGSTPQPGTTASTPCPSVVACQLGYECVWMANTRRSYCCSLAGGSSGLCRVGSWLAPGHSAGTPCQPARPTCPTGYTCQQSASNPLSWYCCSGQYSPSAWTCPLGGLPLLANGRVVTCNVLLSRCPEPYKCQTAGHWTGRCCASLEQVVVCPTGWTPYRSGERAALCGGEKERCPSGATCVLRKSNMRAGGICCIAADGIKNSHRGITQDELLYNEDGWDDEFEDWTEYNDTLYSSLE